MKLVALACLLIVLSGCSSVVVARGSVPTAPAQCQPTNQDAYVYSPDRLEILSPCIRVTGVVDNVVTNPFDGDAVMGLRLDPDYERFLTAANRSALGGTLHIEIICYVMPPPPFGERARANCSLDPNPLRGPLPSAGEHVWMEGRWVLDHSHGGWAELHPLYRWGMLK